MSFDNLPDVPPLTLPGGPEYAACALARSREAASRLPVTLDIPFGTGPFQALDVYRPVDTGGTDLPVLMFVHGGAWAKGHKEWMGFMAPVIVGLPAVFVSVNHRMAPHARHPAQLEDCAAALAWIAQHIGEFGGSSRRIFVGGHSSGGHLAALLALRAGHGTLGHLSVELVRGCAILSAPLNLNLRAAEGRRADIIRQFLADEGDDLDASPVHQVHPASIPFIIGWGTRDLPEVMAHGRQFVDRLRATGVQVREIVLEGLGHFDTSLACEDRQNEWVRAVQEMMMSSAPGN